jgi:hypothetical protein
MSRVEAGPHAIALFHRRTHDDLRREWHLGDARKCVGDHFRLDLALPVVRDVRIQGSTARPVDVGRSSIRTRVEDGDDVSKRELLVNAIDADTYALSRDRAGDEDDLSLVPREHAPAGDGLVDGNDDL